MSRESEAPEPEAPEPEVPESEAPEPEGTGTEAPESEAPEESGQPDQPEEQDQAEVETEAENAETGESEAVEPEAAASGSNDARSWLSRYLVPILGALVATMLVVVASLGYKAVQAGADVSNRTQAMSAAKTAAKSILSYDYRHYEKDVGATKGFLTGRFAREYAKTNKTVVSKFVDQIQAVAVGEVLDASVIASSGDRVDVLVFADQTTDNKAREPRRDHARLRLTMDRVGDRWLVSDLADV